RWHRAISSTSFWVLMPRQTPCFRPRSGTARSCTRLARKERRMRSEAGKVNHKTMRTNDGESVPIPERGGRDVGQLMRDTSYSNETLFERDPGGINGKMVGMESLEGDNLDRPGFDADNRQIYKHGIPYGEAAMFNQLPPGHDIDDQAFTLINNMPFRVY